MIPKDAMEKKLFGGLDTLEHKVVDEYMKTNKLHRKLLEKNLNKSGVFRSQHQLLMYIYCHPSVSQKELAKLYNVSTATVAVSLKKLEKGGYIRRLMDKEDNRINQTLITPKGQAIVESSVSFFRMVEAGMFDGFSQEELERLHGFLSRIHKNIDRMLNETESEGQNL